MHIETLNTSKMRTNTYVVINGNRAFVVDPGDEASEIWSCISKFGATLEAILLTHGHFDHIGAVAELTDIAKGNGSGEVAVIMHRDDCDKIASYKNMGFAVGVKVQPFVPDVVLVGGESLAVAGVKIKVIHTPGHTNGGVCYVAEDKLFSGDTLFLGTYGRTDLYDGSFAKIKNAIVNKLFKLNGNYTVLPGHGNATTLDYERKYNAVLIDSGEPIKFAD